MSKSLPVVSIVTTPLDAAVQRYQREWPPALPAWPGSPASFVAATELPVAVAEVPDRTSADAKASFAGAVAYDQFRTTLPIAPVPVPRQPSTAIRYLVPEVAAKATRLCCWTLSTMSSLLPIVVSAPTLVPV